MSSSSSWFSSLIFTLKCFKSSFLLWLESISDFVLGILTLKKQQIALSKAMPHPEESMATCHNLSSPSSGDSSHLSLSVKTFFSRYSSSNTDSDSSLSTTESLFASKHLIIFILCAQRFFKHTLVLDFSQANIFFVLLLKKILKTFH